MCGEGSLPQEYYEVNKTPPKGYRFSKYLQGVKVGNKQFYLGYQLEIGFLQNPSLFIGLLDAEAKEKKLLGFNFCVKLEPKDYNDIKYQDVLVL